MPPRGPPYAELLAESLGPDFEVANVGCGGTSSLDWTRSRGSLLCGSLGFVLPNLYEGRALPELPADIVTILLGTNDALGFFELAPVQPADYRDAIGELSTSLVADGAGRVLVMTPPPNLGNPAAQVRLSAYRDVVLDLCGAPGDAVLCGPDVFALLGPADFQIGDNIHPNAAGHGKIAAALHESIVASVPEPGTVLFVAVGLGWLAGSRRRARPRAPARADRWLRVSRVPDSNVG